MATQKLSIKLLVDKKANRVLFAEAGKDFVDFLISIMSLPVGSVIRLLTKQKMSGSLGNLYESIENLSDIYMQPNQNKDLILKPRAAIGAANVLQLLPNDAGTAATYYMCRNYHHFLTDNTRAICPFCKCTMSTQIYVAGVNDQGVANKGEGGYVKGVVTYMVMDDLVVMPMSTISGITILNKFNIENVNLLEDKVVEFGMEEGLELLKISLQSKSVLSELFTGRNY